MEEVATPDPIVEIALPDPEPVVQPTVPDEVKTQELSPSNPPHVDNSETPQAAVTSDNLITPQNMPVHPNGRPCEYCANKEEIDRKTREYIASGNGEKPRMLFLNELAAIILKKHRETIMEWTKGKNNCSDKHGDFSDMIKTVEELQEFRLQQRVLGRYNPTGAIFLLKTKHGYIESDKRIITGDAKEPLEIKIIEEDREKYQE